MEFAQAVQIDPPTVWAGFAFALGALIQQLVNRAIDTKLRNALRRINAHLRYQDALLRVLAEKAGVPMGSPPRESQADADSNND